MSEGSSLLLRDLRTKSAGAILAEQNPAALTEKIAPGDPTLTGLCVSAAFGRRRRCV